MVVAGIAAVCSYAGPSGAGGENIGSVFESFASAMGVEADAMPTTSIASVGVKAVWSALAVAVDPAVAAGASLPDESTRLLDATTLASSVAGRSSLETTESSSGGAGYSIAVASPVMTGTAWGPAPVAASGTTSSGSVGFVTPSSVTPHS